MYKYFLNPTRQMNKDNIDNGKRLCRFFELRNSSIGTRNLECSDVNVRTLDVRSLVYTLHINTHNI